MQWASAIEQAAYHDWISHRGEPEVRSVGGFVRAEVPIHWKRRPVGRHVLLVTPPEGGVTVGMTPGGSGERFHAVVSRLARQLKRCRVLHRAAVQQHGLDGLLFEGVGMHRDVTVEWFVVVLGDARCGAVLYGVGPRSRYDEHLDAMRALVASVRPARSSASGVRPRV